VVVAGCFTAEQKQPFLVSRFLGALIARATKSLRREPKARLQASQAAVALTSSVQRAVKRSFRGIFVKVAAFDAVLPQIGKAHGQGFAK